LDAPDPMKLWKMKRFQQMSGRAPQRSNSPPARASSATPDLWKPRMAADTAEAAGRSPSREGRRQRQRGLSPDKGADRGELAVDSEVEREPTSDAEAAAREPESPWEETWDAAGEVEDFEELAEAEAVEETPRFRTRPETTVKIFMSIRHVAPEEVDNATRVMACCVRSNFPDSVVKVREVTSDQSRQQIRSEHNRYMAWGAAALRVKADPDKGTPASASFPVTLVLGIRHTSNEELETATRAVLHRIRGQFAEGFLQVREITPPLPEHVRPKQEPPPVRYPMRPKFQEQFQRPAAPWY